MSGQTARNIWEFDGQDNEKASEVVYEIKERLANLNSKREEKIRQLEEEVINASAREMKLRRQIRNLERQLTEKNICILKLQNLLKKLNNSPDSNLGERINSKNPKGYFKILGLHLNAFDGLNDEQAKTLITKVFQFHSFIHHPDKGGNAGKMTLLNEAYSFFMNSRNRARYGKN